MECVTESTIISGRDPYRTIDCYLWDLVHQKPDRFVANHTGCSPCRRICGMAEADTRCKGIKLVFIESESILLGWTTQRRLNKWRLPVGCIYYSTSGVFSIRHLSRSIVQRCVSVLGKNDFVPQKWYHAGRLSGPCYVSIHIYSGLCCPLTFPPVLSGFLFIACWALLLFLRLFCLLLRLLLFHPCNWYGHEELPEQRILIIAINNDFVFLWKP